MKSALLILYIYTERERGDFNLFPVKKVTFHMIYEIITLFFDIIINII